MGNTILFRRDTPVDDWLHMSNGATAVFINVLVLSGSALAQTDEEKQMIVWLAEKNQFIIGLGTVGFAVAEMPWSKECFASQRTFMLRTVDAACAKLRWELLDYVPREDYICACLAQFRQYIERMTEDDIIEQTRTEWLNDAGAGDPIRCGFPRCEKHGTLLAWCGCQVCTD